MVKGDKGECSEIASDALTIEEESVSVDVIQRLSGKSVIDLQVVTIRNYDVSLQHFLTVSLPETISSDT